MKKVLFSLLALSLMIQVAHAANDPKLIANYGDWNAYSFLDNGSKVCFMSSQPQKQEGKFTKRGEVFMFVTHWPAEKTRNVVSISTGYPYKENSSASVTVDGKDFPMFTQGEMAWTRDQATDDAIAGALQTGSSLTVKGTSKRGTETVDTYGLKGSAEAYKAISKECGL